MKYGTRIKWTYQHALTGHTYTNITKTGTYCGKIKHTVKHWRKSGAKQMVAARFDGNKGMSYVPFDELRRVV